MRYSALSTELRPRSFSAGLFCSLAPLILVFAVVSCSTRPAVPVDPADPDSHSDDVYLADLYQIPPAAVDAAGSGQDKELEAIQLPDPDSAAVLIPSAAAEPGSGDLADGTDSLPDVTVLSRLLIISQLDLPEPQLPDLLLPWNTALGEVGAAPESKRAETLGPTEAMAAAAKTVPSPAAAQTPVSPSAEAPAAGTAAAAAAAVSAAAAEPTKPAPAPLTVPPVVEAEPSLLNVSAYSNQAFILRFSGAGWTFVGDQDGQAGIQFRTRQFENNEVIFSLAPLQAGEYLLLFRRQNPLNQQMESSLVAVTVSDQAPAAEPAAAVATEAATTAAAATATRPTEPAAAVTTAATPPMAAAIAAAPAAASTDRNIGNTASSGSSAVSPAPIPVPAAAIESVPEAESESPVEQNASNPALAALPSDLLAFARAELNAKRVATGLEALNRLAAMAGPLSAGQDELLYLYGLAYELDTSFRDIKLSHQFYVRVRDDFPRSRFRRMVLERIAWMERHFPGLR